MIKQWKKIAILIKSNPILARLKYEQYLTDYPYDYNSWSLYICVLISLKEFDLADVDNNSNVKCISAGERFNSRYNIK